MAAMAPALTEAATQAKIKLPETSAAATSDSVNRRNIRQLAHKEGHLEIASDQLTNIVGKPCNAAPTPVSHLNGDSRRSMDKQPPPVFAKLPTIKVSNLNDLIRKKGAFQGEFVSTILPSSDRPFLGKVPQRMNRPSAGLGNEEAKCRGQIARIGSRIQSLSDIGRSAGGNTPRGSQQARGTQQAQPSSGLSVYQGRSGKNMCRKLGEVGGRAMPNTNTTSAPSPMASPAGRQLTSTTTTTTTSGQLHLLVSSSPESNVDGDSRLDEDVQRARIEAGKKHAQLERRIEFLQRRLRRAQGRQVEQHTRQQLLIYVEYQLQNLQTVAKTISSPANEKNGSDLKKELLSDDVKNLSTAALVSLVQRLQASSSSSFQHHHHHQPQQLLPPQLSKPEVTSILTMADDVRRESKVAAAKLAMNLNFMQSALDSDATESSSGGESGEEEFPEGPEPQLPSTPL